MNQLRYLEKCTLCSRSKTREANGSIVETFSDVSDYLIQVEDQYDTVSASIYGADLNKMIRVCSPHNQLENYLAEKVNFTSDNVTNFCIKYRRFVYEIVSVKKHWIDLKVLCEISQN